MSACRSPLRLGPFPVENASGEQGFHPAPRLLSLCEIAIHAFRIGERSKTWWTGRREGGQLPVSELLPTPRPGKRQAVLHSFAGSFLDAFVPPVPASALAALVAAVCFLGCGKTARWGSFRQGHVRRQARGRGHDFVHERHRRHQSRGPLKDENYTLNARRCNQQVEYKVMVMPLVEQKQEGGEGTGSGGRETGPDIPKRYRVITATDLKATVKDGKREIHFELRP